jgi:hypothetical protein
MKRKKVSYFIMALRSSSGVEMGIILNLSTSTLRMFGVMKAGSLVQVECLLDPNRVATAR